MEPQFDGQKDQRKPHRRPTAEAIPDGDGGQILIDPPRVGPWDAEADADLRLEDRARTRKPAGTALAVAPGGTGGPRAAATRRRLRLTQQALALRASGESVNQIAAALAVAPATIVSWFTTHRRDIAPEAIDDLLDQIAVPLAAENLVHGLLAGDKDYTLETLKGRGRLKRHAEGEAKPPVELPVLAISFQVPVRDARAGYDAIPVGVIIGQPQAPRSLPDVDSPGSGVLSLGHGSARDAGAVVVGRPRGADADGSDGVDGDVLAPGHADDAGLARAETAGVARGGSGRLGPEPETL